MKQPYYERRMSGNTETVTEAARFFDLWDSSTLSFYDNLDALLDINKNPENSIALAKLFSITAATNSRQTTAPIC